VGGRAARPDGPRDLEAGHLPDHAGAGRGHGREGRRAPGEGQGPRGGVQRGAGRRLRGGPALPDGRRGGLRLPVRRAPAQPVGPVPSRCGRPGQAGRHRLPGGHGLRPRPARRVVPAFDGSWAARAPRAARTPRHACGIRRAGPKVRS
jgi:hypothetical protein